MFRAVHRVPSVGYAICSTRRRLRDDLRGQPGYVIRDARLAGEEIDVPEEVVEVAFCGDTTIDVVDREPLVRAARLLILEVTFLDDRVSVAMARGKGHVHLDEVVARADQLQNEAILFTHRSARYSNAWAARRLKDALPASLWERVTLLPFAAPWEG